MPQTPTAKITQAILGPGGRRHQFPVDVQERLDFAIRLNGLLAWRGWVLGDLLDVERVSWIWEPSRYDDGPDEHDVATIVVLNVDDLSIDLTRVGEPWAQVERVDWRGLEVALEGLEAYRVTLPEKEADHG